MIGPFNFSRALYSSIAIPPRQNRRLAQRGLGLCAVALLTLSACGEKEVILPGERETIRPEVQDGPLTPKPDEIDNVSRAISIPGQVGNASWQQAVGTQSNRVSNARLRVAPQQVWSTSIGSGDGRRVRITADPVVAGGLIYTLDSGTLVSGVTPSGQVAWQTNLIPATDKEEQGTGGGIAYDNGTLYVSSGYGRLTALDAKTGAIRWQQKLGATGSGTPLIDGGLIYLVAGDDTGMAIRTSDGRIAWEIKAVPSVANVLGAPAPAIAGPYVVFGFGSGELIAAFRKGGTQRWSATVGGKRIGSAASRIGDITGAPVVSGNTLYAGNKSGRTAAIDVNSGAIRWTARQGAMSPVWPVGGSVFAVTDLNQLARLDASSGDTIWVRDLPANVKERPKKRGPVYGNYGPVLAGGRLVVASGDGYLRFYAPDNGALVATVPIAGGATTGPVVAGNTLYVVSSYGKLHAFR